MNRFAIGLVGILLVSPAIHAGDASPADSTPTFIIRARPVEPATPAEPEWFRPGISEKDLPIEAAKAARLLGQEKPDPATKAAIERGIRKNATTAARGFVPCLDPTRNEPLARRGALRGLEAAKASPAISGRALAAVALGDSVEPLRKQALELIRSTQNRVATKAIVAAWQSSFDEQGIIDNEHQRAAAVAAMKELGDKQVYASLLSYVTMEVRFQNAGTADVGQAFITNGGDINNPLGNINLPIDLPSQEITSVQATLVVPALSALKDISGQDFGRNASRWRKWIDGQPEFK